MLRKWGAATVIQNTYRQSQLQFFCKRLLWAKTYFTFSLTDLFRLNVFHPQTNTLKSSTYRPKQVIQIDLQKLTRAPRVTFDGFTFDGPNVLQVLRQS